MAVMHGCFLFLCVIQLANCISFPHAEFHDSEHTDWYLNYNNGTTNPETPENYIYEKPPVHHRQKRSFTLHAWTNFRSNRFRSYRYGFPKGTSLASLIPSKANSGFKAGNLAHKMSDKAGWCAWHRKQRGVDNCLWGFLVELVEKNRVPIDAEELSILHIWLVCWQLQGNNGICPRPCGRDPCRDKSHTVSNKCKPTLWQLYEDNYSCTCAHTYQWDHNAQECRRFDICRASGNNACIYSNTELCTLGSQSFQCQCKEQYMGARCENPRDACVANYNSELPRGVDACGFHGTCTPRLGSNVYTCDCKKGYTDNPDNNYQDCQKKVSACQLLLCIRGYCHTSPNLDTAVCICDEGFGGKDCSQEEPFWNQWGPWGQCTPKCGNPRNRKRFRTCNDKNKGCRGNTETFQTCAPKVCVVRGKWTQWASWGECSEKCGGGRRVRDRSCDFEEPIDGGPAVPCNGKAVDSGDCNQHECPAKGDKKGGSASDTVEILTVVKDILNAKEKTTDANGWLFWKEWQPCSVDCGHGDAVRKRTCTLDKCTGKHYDVKACQTPCPPGKYPWSMWSSWSQCPDGVESCQRQRTCPMGNGNCDGSDKENSKCIDGLCNGKYGLSLLQMQRMGLSDAVVKAQSSFGVQGAGYVQSLEAGPDGYPFAGPAPPGHQAGGASSKTGIIAGCAAGVLVVILAVVGYIFRGSICGSGAGNKDSLSDFDVPRRSRGRLLGDGSSAGAESWGDDNDDPGLVGGFDNYGNAGDVDLLGDDLPMFGDHENQEVPDTGFNQVAPWQPQRSHAVVPWQTQVNNQFL